MLLRFTKMHGLGNDFMVVDGVTQKIFFSPELIKKLADRHFGIGFDQLLLVEPPFDPEVDFHYRIFNADGSFSLETKAFADPDTNWTYISVASGAGNGDVVSFSARRSSSIYGKSDTVQPSSIIGIWLVKAYGLYFDEGSMTMGSMDARLSRLEGLLTTIQDGEELTY